MKTSFLVLLAGLIIFFSGNIYAQGGRKSVEERVTIVHEKFESSLKLDKAKLKDLDDIFTDFYKAQDKLRENIQRPAQPGGGLAQGFAKQDFQSVRQQNEDIITERNNRLKKLLTTEQFKTWTDEIEPALRPRRVRN